MLSLVNTMMMKTSAHISYGFLWAICMSWITHYLLDRLAIRERTWQWTICRVFSISIRSMQEKHWSNSFHHAIGQTLASITRELSQHRLVASRSFPHLKRINLVNLSFMIWYRGVFKRNSVLTLLMAGFKTLIAQSPSKRRAKTLKAQIKSSFHKRGSTSKSLLRRRVTK